MTVCYLQTCSPLKAPFDPKWDNLTSRCLPASRQSPSKIGHVCSSNPAHGHCDIFGRGYTGLNTQLLKFWTLLLQSCSAAKLMKCVVDFVRVSTGKEIRTKQRGKKNNKPNKSSVSKRRREPERELVHLRLKYLVWILQSSTSCSIFAQSTQKSPTFFDNLCRNNKSLYFHFCYYHHSWHFPLGEAHCFIKTPC